MNRTMRALVDTAFRLRAWYEAKKIAEVAKRRPAPMPERLFDVARLLLAFVVVASCGAGARPARTTTEQDGQAAILRQLRDEQVQWRAGHERELARWTPEMHAAARSLADKKYSSGRAAIEAAVAGAHRKPGNAARDKYRHPVETLEAFGFDPTMTVLEVDPGEGWYTELLAPALASGGAQRSSIKTP